MVKRLRPIETGQKRGTRHWSVSVPRLFALAWHRKAPALTPQWTSAPFR